ncbi:serine hydroxymethyltransferase [Rhodopirellula sp. JC740]|uniref:Serine hydroxymethyltransferase n=1 Tax=Rhodopirellula halodulae TaxID=2894198 RepID=A0ABS8NDB0_9BACT|nr:serine hydroxymethyltransferase [Rhodopirellula sp. JC740]MCC9641540.1 serine hydroxymethyltransferase [Rhodopirellula sp. JC740]
MSFIQSQDPAIWDAIQAETTRQQDGLEMIASENYTSPAIMEAVGSVLTNKYAEGYPGRRYYGGCEHVDVVETIAIDRAKELFGAEAANVQPHSGSQANAAVYLSCLEVGDTVLGLDLAQGGHLTHGMKLNISGRLYNFVNYGVDKVNHRLDFDQIAKLAREHKPKLIVAGASAYPREIPHDKFKEIADEVGAKLMVDMAHYAGLVAAKIHNSPVPFADYVTTTTHKTLRGPRSGLIMCKEEHLKLVNRNVFPGTQGGPLMHVVAGKAICFAEAMTEEYAAYGQSVVDNARVLADTLLGCGLRLVSGGTDNHLMLVDVTAVDLGGKKAEAVLDACGITVNMNMIPFDERKPMDPSGIRIGTPALTTRGMGQDEMKRIGQWIYDALSDADNTSLHESIRSDIREMAQNFPVPAAAQAPASVG